MYDYPESCIVCVVLIWAVDILYEVYEEEVLAFCETVSAPTVVETEAAATVATTAATEAWPLLAVPDTPRLTLNAMKNEEERH